MELKKIQKDIWQNKVNKGFNTTLFNKYYHNKDYDINFNFYETECRKIINTIEDKQLTLF